MTTKPMDPFEPILLNPFEALEIPTTDRSLPESRGPLDFREFPLKGSAQARHSPPSMAIVWPVTKPALVTSDKITSATS